MRLLHGMSFLLLICPIAAHAAEKPNVTAPPISNRLLEGEIELIDGETIGFKALEGTLITIQSPSTGALALSGEILDENSRQVRFVMFRIDSYGPGLQGLTQIETLEVRDGLTSSMRSLALDGLKVSGIKRSDRVTEADVKAYREHLFGRATGGGEALESGPPASTSSFEDVESTCCVNCGSVTACGCKVTMSCGSCCAGACCSGTGPIRDTRD